MVIYQHRRSAGIGTGFRSTKRPERGPMIRKAAQRTRRRPSRQDDVPAFGRGRRAQAGRIRPQSVRSARAAVEARETAAGAT